MLDLNVILGDRESFHLDVLLGEEGGDESVAGKHQRVGSTVGQQKW